MGKQCLLQSEIKRDHAHCSGHGSFYYILSWRWFLWCFCHSKLSVPKYAPSYKCWEVNVVLPQTRVEGACSTHLWKMLRFKFYKHYVVKVIRGCNYIDLNITFFFLMGMHNGIGLSSVSISDMPIRWLLVLTESEDGLYFVFVYVCSILWKSIIIYFQQVSFPNFPLFCCLYSNIYCRTFCDAALVLLSVCRCIIYDSGFLWECACFLCICTFCNY